MCISKIVSLADSSRACDVHTKSHMHGKSNLCMAKDEQEENQGMWGYVSAEGSFASCCIVKLGLNKQQTRRGVQKLAL